jgi:hypothetical protein
VILLDVGRVLSVEEIALLTQVPENGVVEAAA